MERALGCTRSQLYDAVNPRDWKLIHPMIVKVTGDTEIISCRVGCRRL